MKAIKERRKKRLIDKKTQFKLISIIIAYIITYFLILALLVFLPLIYSLIMETSLVKRYQIANAFVTLHTYLWPALFIVLILVCFHSIRFTHRIVGPVYKLKDLLRHLRKDDLSIKMTLRKHDFFRELEEEVNSTIGHLKENIAFIRLQTEELNEALSRLKGSLGVDVKKETGMELKRIGEIESSLKVFLDRFQGV